MRRFTLVAACYILACLIAITVIVIRGDGPHPRVIATYPPNGDQFFPGGIAEITFSQQMNEASVERALQVSPGTEGQGSWFGTTLNLEPDGDWKPNVTYRVQLTGAVTDTEGRPLHTPVSFQFRVHRLGHLTLCHAGGRQEVCERTGSSVRPVFSVPGNVEQFALSEDRTQIAYTRVTPSGLPHLFLINADGTQNIQLTGGRSYADSDPFWTPGDSSDISYYRRPVTWNGPHPHVGGRQMWSIATDGSNNYRL